MHTKHPKLGVFFLFSKIKHPCCRYISACKKATAMVFRLGDRGYPAVRRVAGWVDQVEIRLTSALVWVEVELSWGWAWQKLDFFVVFISLKYINHKFHTSDHCQFCSAPCPEHCQGSFQPCHHAVSHHLTPYPASLKSQSIYCFGSQLSKGSDLISICCDAVYHLSNLSSEGFPLGLVGEGVPPRYIL